MQQLPDYENAKNQALKILDDFGYTSPPVNPSTICDALGIRVYAADFKGESDNISGFYDGTKNEIYVNRKDYLPRQVFTVAHELGHKVLHEEWLNSSNYKALLRGSINEPEDPKEKEANFFAANLLVPRFMLEKYYKIASIEELARVFMVSSKVVAMRIKFEFEYGRK